MKKLVIACIFLLAYSAHGQEQIVFGSKNAGLVNLKGKIYFLPEEVEGMPENIEQQKVEGIIYSSKLDVPLRDFTEGFPGVSNRFEYFGIIYDGIIEISQAGSYTFRLNSDDGSILWINNKEIINNDGVHGEQTAEGNIHLNKGLHKIKIWYFQGPATEICLQFFVKKPNSDEEEIVDLKHFNSSLLRAAETLNASLIEEGILISLPEKLLFESGKSNLISGANGSFEALKVFLNMYPEATVQINGHTDAIGNAQENLKLSDERANAVLLKLKDGGLSKDIQFTTKGYGHTKPVAKNTDETGRSQNRRVEIIIKP
jgi:outer membrane protein OmpA-like peptidoglycan-associated protein